MLTKDLLRISRAGGGYAPQFADRADRPLAARVIGTFQGHVGEPRADLEAALARLEADADFKLVRGLAKLVEREATFETRAPLPPERTRAAVFAAAEAGSVVTVAEREEALSQAATNLASTPEQVSESLYADLTERQILDELSVRWDPDDLLDQYNLSLAQTALFDATELRIRSSDPKALISAIKRLRLMYEIRKTEAGREVIVTGPTGLFQTSRRYGTRFARLLRSVAKASEWRIEATIDDRGTERLLTLTHEDVAVPDADPVAEVSFDSGVESDFAARFSALGLDWNLVREPEPLEAGASVMIPDFAFDWKHSKYRIYFEIMGFWTPEYVEKKLRQMDLVEDVELLVAVDSTLGVGEDIAARDHRAIPYTGSVRVKDVVDVLREYEADLVAASAADLAEELSPDADVITLETLASDLGVSESVLSEKRFPDHERVGRTLVRPAVLDSLRDEIQAGMSLSEAEGVFATYGLDDASAILSRLGYRVEWEGLSGGTVRAKSID
ncbi:MULTISPECIES: DUF790 family protein [unclassified Haladaptatus]|uniref:DUF790 family protein n=1 Tax=unclassified Haladaptatus TaxID=2622732 RepID=UPI0023E7F435|nr:MULTISPECIES: DUF790 family protein [unclassified Haladaptatus]